MEASWWGDEPADLPSIFQQSNLERSGRFGSSSDSFSVTTSGSGDVMNAPPPLSPPQLPFDKLDTHPQEPRQHHCDSYSPRECSYHDSLGDSQYGSPSMEPVYNNNEGYFDIGSSSASASTSISAGFGLHHNQFQFLSNADTLANMKKKLAPWKKCDNNAPSSHPSMSSTSSTGGSSRRRPSGDMCVPADIVSTKLPLHLETSSLLDSPDRYTQAPHSALPPLPKPAVPSQLRLSLPVLSNRINSDDAPSHSDKADKMETGETNSTKRLRLEDPMRTHYDGARAKRRASMDPDNRVPLAFITQDDSFRRRDGNQGGSPTPRLSVIPQGSISSSSGRAGWYSSNLSLLTESMGSSSFKRVSPDCVSPGRADPSCSPPRSSLSRAPRQRALSESRPLTSPRKLTGVSKPGGTTISEFFICDCCPKKSKEFESAEELASHQAEKQYECKFCGNRFKNKNEAGRHENSVHVRGHSWSCPDSDRYDRTLHDSPNRPGAADSCGYCGEEFSGNGSGPGASAPRHATDHDWGVRLRHLQEVHKVGVCDTSKEYFRADHFRQHLKHSHAGTSGKWTNMLENACMLNEGPTPK
ncbi:hypothetical protein Landi51_13642 [Colletotrichum acutatum]